MSDPRLAIGIAGAGRVAQALGRLLAESGRPVAAVAGRTEAGAARAASFIGPGVRSASFENLPSLANRIIVAVSDDAIEAVAKMLAAAGMREGVVLHTSGAHGPRPLRALSDAGVSCGVLHPLQTIATPERGVAALRGATFGVGGQAEATRWAEEIVRAAGGTALRIASGGFASYHAGAVMASNAVIAALDAAVVLMAAAGVERDAALEAVGPLCLHSAQNTIELGPERALTGPIQRGDVDTVRAHAAALHACPAHVADLYRASARALIEISRRRGLDAGAAAAMSRALET